MVKLLIIADDFTGALDTGIQFKKQGICTQVFTKKQISDDEIKPDTQVLVIDSETRPLSKDEAYSEVKSIAEWALSAGIEIIFKKTDSALRGNIGAELSALADAAKNGTVFFLPGYPGMNRITKDGFHYIDGELLEKSVFGQDPFEPVTKSYIPDIIHVQSDVSVVSVKTDETVQKTDKEISEIVVCDTVASEDIKRRLDELLQKKCLRLIAGCAGLAECLADKLSFTRSETVSYRKTKGLYVACGSLNRITENQVKYAEAHGGFKTVHLTMEQKLKPEYYETAQGKQFEEQIISLCEKHKRVIADTFDRDDTKDEFIKQNDIKPSSVRFRITDSHSCIVDEVVKKLDFTILMTGGDTLMGYMKKTGCTQIEPLCEIEQGVVVSNIVRAGKSVQVISKSGGFGTCDIFCRIADKIIE